MPAILDQGISAARDTISSIVSHVGISTDDTAFAANQTRLDPTAAATNLIKAATNANIDFQTFDASISVAGSEVTGQFFTIGILDGAGATDALSRSVRINPVGIDPDDNYVVAVRVTISDETP